MENKKEIFFCYAREDETLRIELGKQLDFLQRQSFIHIWHDREISAGAEWQREIDVHLNTAHFILLLVSPDFMHSDYCYGKEMKRAMERHEAREALVIPIILRPVHWQEAPFGKLQALPKDGQPVLSPYWHNQDEAFFNVAEGIRKAITEKIPLEPYDVSLNYSAADAVWVENLARRLKNEHSFRVLLNKWTETSELVRYQDNTGNEGQTSCNVLFLGEQTPLDWFKEELHRSFDRWKKEPSCRVIPVLLPNARATNLLSFPALGVWINFHSDDQAYAFHALACGIKGIPPGRWPPRKV